jgi:hypothetical protein
MIRNTPKAKIKVKLRKYTKRIGDMCGGKHILPTSKFLKLSGFSLNDYIDSFSKGMYKFEEYVQDSKKYHIDHIIPVSYYAPFIRLDEYGQITKETNKQISNNV